MTLRSRLIQTGLAAALGVGGCSPGTETAAPPAATVRVSRTTASSLAPAVARLPHITLQVTTEGGSSITSLNDVRNRTTDISAPLADVAYLAYAGQLEDWGEPFTDLRGMAVTDLNTMHLIVAPHARVSSPGDLRGMRVSVGAPGSSTALITTRMLQDFGIGPGQIHAERIPNSEIVSRLSNGTLDAAFSGFNPPSGNVVAALRAGARLVPLDGPEIEQMRTEYPYLKRTLIPRGIYPNQPEPIRTIGVDVLLVCRADLDEDVVYALLDAYFATQPATTPPDLERAPATPIPLHPGAARYYRQRELAR